MSENTYAADELLTQGQSIVSVKAEEVIPAIAAIKGVQLLKAALIAENAGKVRVTVVAALEEAIKAIEAPAGNTNDTEGGKPPSTEGDLPPKDSVAPVTLVDMVLDEPQFEGGPTTAQVHPDEVPNYAVGGEFSAPPAPPPHVPTAAEILAKNTSVRQSLMLSAGTAIAPLQDALDLGILRPEEQALLTQWKTFRVDVSRTDLTLENPGWPVPPGPLYVVEAPGTQNA